VEFAFQYEPAFLKEKIERLKQKFPSLEERSSLTPEKIREIDIFVNGIRESVVSGNNICTSVMHDRDLELLIHAYHRYEIFENDALRGTFDYILKKRFKRKLFYLGWLLLQHDYGNSGSKYAMKLLCRHMKERFPEEYGKSLLGKIEEISSCNNSHNFHEIIDNWLPLYSAELLKEEGGTVKSFIRKYSISSESDFSKKMQTSYFSFCRKYNFECNKEQLSCYFELMLKNTGNIEEETANIPARLLGVVSVFCNYLDKLKTVELYDKVVLQVIEHFGLPCWNGVFWKYMEENLKNSTRVINSWLKYKRLEKHFEENPKALSIWTEYFENIRDIYFDESRNFLAMHCCNFVVVDLKERDRSYLYPERIFSEEYQLYVERLDSLKENQEKESRQDKAESSEEFSEESSGESSKESPVETSVESSEESSEEPFTGEGYIPVGKGYIDINGTEKGKVPVEWYGIYTREEEDKENGKEGWRIIEEHVVPARDLVIENKKGRLYSVGYDKVSVLYLKEIIRNMCDSRVRKKDKYIK